MSNFWDSVKDTAKALGGAVAAPPGAVLDLAQMPFDSHDDDFGSVLAAISKRGGDFFKPLVDPNTFTGSSITRAMQGANWLFDNGVNEPISTFFLATQHASSPGGDGISDVFDGKVWSQAYKIAQETGAGKAIAFGLLSTTGPNGNKWHGDSRSDPFQYDSPYYDLTKKDYPHLAPAIDYGAAAVGMWFIDPVVLGSKGLGALHMATRLGKLTHADKTELFNKITSSSRSGLLGRNLQSRTDRYLDFLSGNNALGRPLNDQEILHSSPELARYAGEKHTIAGLLGEANTIENIAVRKDVQRRVLAVAGGDLSQIRRLEDELQGSSVIADQLRNMVMEGSIDLKMLAAHPQFAHEPMFINYLERQLHNINDGEDGIKAVDRFMDGYQARLKQELGIQNMMPNLPGVHVGTSNRLLKRENEIGAGRSLYNAHHKVDDWAAQHWATAMSHSSVFQKGFHALPVVVVKTAGLLASPYTKAPVAMADSLRTVHFTGVANVHDWGGAINQFESALRLAKVDAGTRIEVLNKAYRAKTEIEKVSAAEYVESVAMKSLAEEFSARYGREINRAYIEDLMQKGFYARKVKGGQLRGRAYAASEMEPDMAAAMQLRHNSAMNALDEARAAAGAQSKKFSPPEKVNWRVDMIDDHGTPLSLPLIETQLTNSIPLIDMNVARKALKRDNTYFARLSRAWADEGMEMKRLSELKETGHLGIDRMLRHKADTMDWLTRAGELSMRVWKFSVLFRLGYPIRVIADDHWRIWTQMNAARFYGDNGTEWMKNLRYNRFTRFNEAHAARHADKVRRDEILTELNSDRILGHGARKEELAALKRSIRANRAAATRLRNRLSEDGIDGNTLSALESKLAAKEAALADQEGGARYLLEQLGETSPDQLRRELEGINEMLGKGVRAYRMPKHTIGMRDVDLGDGQSIPGAFAGPSGHASWEASSSGSTFDIQMSGVEDRVYTMAHQGSHRTIQSHEAGHLHAWADVLNNQIRQSPVAMHFLRGGTVDDFVRWVKSPEQAELRRRLPHFAYDPEDWGHRVNTLVHDYLPTQQLRDELVSGSVSTRTLSKLFQDPSVRPAVHGRVVADNLGSSDKSLAIGKAMNGVYRWLGEMPTDHLSRHPFFSSMYKQHAREMYAVRKAAYAKTGQRFTQKDLDDITTASRKLALKDVKRTLFDISAHSHAAHVMRFMSPFFAAQQEVLMRWWRIAADQPQVVRRFTQAMDAPRWAGLVIDENGEQVAPGTPISKNHRILLQLPKDFGGPDVDEKWSKWSLGENSFNLVLQNGVTNPGFGPLVAVPMEWAAARYADQTEIARVARIFNPFPPNSPLEAALPATLKRAAAMGVSARENPDLGYDGPFKILADTAWKGAAFIPDVMGVGLREYNNSFSQNTQDEMVTFLRKYGREPNAQEKRELMLRAGRETNVDMMLRLAWNAGSPAPATPRSKYAAIQNAWYQISEQTRAEGKGYEEAYAQFKEKFGDAYMPLVYSDATNPAHLEATPGTVAALKKYRPILDRVDPEMTRLVIGSYADDLADQNAVMGDFSMEARNYLRTTSVRPGSTDRYYAYDEPAKALEEQQARRGWQKYGEITGALTAQAQQMGLDSYEDSPQLVAIKRAAVERLKAENDAFNTEYGMFDATKYDRYVSDMRALVETPALANDPERTDIKFLGAYLKLRDLFTGIIDARQQAGLGGPDAQATQPILKLYTLFVHKLVEGNTMFETHMYNGMIERDPLLVGDN